jgi:uncharacterized membrane protein YhdT
MTHGRHRTLCGAFTSRLLVGAPEFTSDTGQVPRTVRIGLALFVLGLGFIAADVLPFFASHTNRPLWLNLACLLAPLGFALAVGSALRRGRREQREVARQVAAQGDVPH